jgi:hypothetical protein
MLGTDHTPSSFLLLVFGPQPIQFNVLEGVGIVSTLVVAGLTLGPFISLSYCLVSARLWKDPQLGWLVNAKELIAGDVSSEYPSFLGTKRCGNCHEWIICGIKTPVRCLGMFFWNMFFRRVESVRNTISTTGAAITDIAYSKVETKKYDFFLNTFALLAIAATRFNDPSYRRGWSRPSGSSCGSFMCVVDAVSETPRNSAYEVSTKTVGAW